MDSGLSPDLVPDRLQSHPDDRVKVLELRISDIDIVEIEILWRMSISAFWSFR
jgi:hypothetical protein